ncbi:hypothetical protein [Bradyrhizobium sp. 191]|uniref:hypothetical protein n=1 Tax=Bradyrhizobium sp. 191 TaxID=2782659 RepID=UPI001FFEBB89|nr:hypothetical protein [Bradyrhizobium sp. 191]UPJ63725.1 hypothetical protein IVB23_27530 [Bradyrhizobium sp. 191]
MIVEHRYSFVFEAYLAYFLFAKAASPNAFGRPRTCPENLCDIRTRLTAGRSGLQFAIQVEENVFVLRALRDSLGLPRPAG